MYVLNRDAPPPDDFFTMATKAEGAVVIESVHPYDSNMVNI